MDIQEYISSGIIEQYVMGLCTVAEKSEIESLRRQHPELNKAIYEYEILLEETMQKNQSLPSAEIDEKILKLFSAFPAASSEITKKAIVKKMNWLRPVAAAAILLLIVSGYYIYTLNNKATQLQQELAEVKKAPATLPLSDYQIMMDPKITPVAMYGVGTHAICRCTMFWDRKTVKIFL